MSKGKETRMRKKVFAFNFGQGVESKDRGGKEKRANNKENKWEDQEKGGRECKGGRSYGISLHNYIWLLVNGGGSGNG